MATQPDNPPPIGDEKLVRAAQKGDMVAYAYAAGETYFPEGMPAVEWYRPTDRGLEQRIREKLKELRSRK